MRFSVRDLLWLTLVVAMVLGWWGHTRRLQSDARRLQTDLLYQADLVDTFAYALKQFGCEIPDGTGPTTKILVPEKLQSTAISFTTPVPREQLQRALDGEFNRFREQAN